MLITLLAGAAAIMPALGENAPVGPGTIAIVAGGDHATTDAVARTFVDAVRQAVLQRGFLPLPDPDHSLYVATVAVTQVPHGVVMAAGGKSKSEPLMTSGGGGLSFSLPSGKNQLHGLIVTRLTVTISRRSDRHSVWSGVATTTRIGGTQTGDPAVIAGTLSNALFAWFPRRLPGPLSVP